ncbi:GDSL-type esterase/lipase family protein [Zhihengliuella halotolerans]|uniref:GDSL-type esterase/lipase family protein n=1 Tax=Zhihengliuella halotolerans TaxID=370736 RepID=UPI000C81025C|nr:GDSL-type esterase/lipase family protein [Zhihengliuella halotolerans]
MSLDSAATRPERVFSFGTLLDPKVQQALFGRQIETTSDELLEHGTTTIQITDPEVIATSGKEIHLGLVRREGDTVKGGVLTLTPAELATADAYEVADYARRRVTTRNGGQVWCYVSSDPLAVAERIALIGDSIAYGHPTQNSGWAAQVAAQHTAEDEEHRRFVNLARPGALLGEVLDAATMEVPNHRSDTVLVAAGINDILRSTPGSGEFVSKGLIDHLDNFATLMEMQGRRIVVMSPNWLDNSRIGVDLADVQALREALRSWCRISSRDFLDTWTVLENRPDFFTDGIQPSAEGHTRLAQVALGHELEAHN